MHACTHASHPMECARVSVRWLLGGDGVGVDIGA